MKKRADGRCQRKITLPDGTPKHVYGTSPAEVNRKAKEIERAFETGINLSDRTTVARIRNDPKRIPTSVGTCGEIRQLPRLSVHEIKNPVSKPKNGLNTGFFLGAANQIRTGDLVLTKDVLCLLSHSSIRKRQDELAFCGDPERARTVDL